MADRFSGISARKTLIALDIQIYHVSEQCFTCTLIGYSSSVYGKCYSPPSKLKKKMASRFASHEFGLFEKISSLFEAGYSLA